jgi:hypothetical protein
MHSQALNETSLRVAARYGSKKVAGLDFEEPSPLVFSHRVILQLVAHMVGGDIVVEEPDFLGIRMAFRQNGGSWEKFISGDTIHNNILKDVVVAWSQLPHKKKPETI